jgi:hypothetical protein
MPGYFDDEDAYDGRSRASSLILPPSQRLSLNNDSMVMVMFFGKIEDMLLKSTLSEGANVLRDGVMPSYMANYLDLFDNDNVILQAKGSGPSYWSVSTDDLSCITIRSYNARLGKKSKVAYTGQAARADTNHAMMGVTKSPARLRTVNGKRRGRAGDRDDVDLMSPPTKSSSRSADTGNIERLLEAQQARIRELTLKTQEAKIRDLEMELSNSKSGRTVADKYHDRNATSLLTVFKDVIARVRGNIDASLLCVLDNSPEYVDAERSHDLIRWWTTLQEKTLFSSLSKVQFAAGLDAALSTKKNNYFNLALSKVSFAELATRFIMAYKAFKLADDRITEARMVDYLIDNISGDGIESTRIRIRGAATFDSEAVMAQSSLSHAIELITKGLFLHKSLQSNLNLFATDLPSSLSQAPPPSDRKVGGAAEQNINQAIIMRIEGMAARLDQMASQANSGDGGKSKGNKGGGGGNNNNDDRRKNNDRTYQPVYRPCRNSSSCKYGDNCRYLHNAPGKPDHRLDKDGTFKAQFLPNLGKRSNANNNKATILALSAKLDSLAANLSAINSKDRIFGLPTEIDDEM